MCGLKSSQETLQKILMWLFKIYKMCFWAVRGDYYLITYTAFHEKPYSLHFSIKKQPLGRGFVVCHQDIFYRYQTKEGRMYYSANYGCVKTRTAVLQ